MTLYEFCFKKTCTLHVSLAGANKNQVIKTNDAASSYQTDKFSLPFKIERIVIEM